MEVKQIMVEAVTIDKDQRLSYALDLLEKKKTDRLIVMQDDEIQGILTYADIADRLGVSKVVAISISRLHVSSAMSDTVISVSQDDDVINVAQLMLEREMSGCPVIDEEDKLVGMITKTQLIELVRKFEEIKVDDLMTTDGILIVNPVDRLIKARLELLNRGISGIPVTDGARVLGLLTERMVAEAMARFTVEVPDKHRANQVKKIRVVDAMLQQPPLIEIGSSISKAAEMMLENSINTIPVVGEGNKLIGIITSTDITRFIANKFKVPESD